MDNIRAEIRQASSEVTEAIAHLAEDTIGIITSTVPRNVRHLQHHWRKPIGQRRDRGERVFGRPEYSIRKLGRKNNTLKRYFSATNASDQETRVKLSGKG